jgi:hypothetical protein
MRVRSTRALAREMRKNDWHASCKAQADAMSFLDVQDLATVAAQAASWACCSLLGAI